MATENNIIELRHVKKCYEKDTPVIKDFSLTIKKGEFVTFLGPSGCGKTTILRMIGGFEQPTGGEILLHGKDISKLPPAKRPINTVFQKYALFPYLNIYDNIAFGLKMKKVPKEVIREKVKKVLEVVDLEGFEKRKISTLSGGQQQRVAIARAIVNEPEILLLDEPLGALDYKMRKEMQFELKEMHKELGITFIFVTHDQEEALTMSDKIVVMKDGEIQQIGSPVDIYNEPTNAFVADFIGDSNIINGTMIQDKVVEILGVKIPCVDEGFGCNTPVDVVIRPEDVVLGEEGQGILDGVVTSLIFKGVHYEMEVEANGYEWLVHSTNCHPVGSKVSISVIPFNIQIMHKPESEDEKAVTIDE